MTTHQIGQLTSSELDKTIAAAEWLVGISANGIVDPITRSKISTLLADCRGEEEDRVTAAHTSRQAAMAAAQDDRIAEESRQRTTGTKGTKGQVSA